MQERRSIGRGLGIKGHYRAAEAHEIRSYYSEAEIEEHGDLEAPPCGDIGPAVDLKSLVNIVVDKCSPKRVC